MANRVDPVAYDMPAGKPHFVDRVDDLALAFRAVDGRHERDRPLCVVVSGISGIGKTELVYRFLRKVWRRLFPDGVLCVNLNNHRRGGVLELEEAVRYLLLRLGATPGFSGCSLEDLCKQYNMKTMNSRIVIVIDNAESGSELEHLLPTSADSMVVVTSRRSLIDLEEGAAVNIRLSPLDEQDARDLLLLVSGDPRLAADEATALELARLCDGLPRTVRIAAIAARKNPHLDIPALVSGVRDVRPHARRRLRSDGDQEELLGALRRYVRWLLRQAQIADNLTASKRLILASLVSKLPYVEDVRIMNGYQWLEAERRTLYACVILAYENGLYTEAWSLCEPLFAHYQDHPSCEDAINAFRIGLDAAWRADSISAVVRMHCQLARPFWDQARFNEAEYEIDQAFSVLRLLGNSKEDRRLGASAVEFRGRLCGARGKWGEAVTNFKKALRVSEEIGNSYGVMHLSYRLGEAAAKLGEPQQAVEWLERAHRMAEDEELSDRLFARIGFALGGVLHGLGQVTRVHELYAESLKSAQSRHSDFDQLRVLDALATLADEVGNAAAAQNYRAAAKKIRGKNGVSSS